MIRFLGLGSLVCLALVLGGCGAESVSTGTGTAPATPAGRHNVAIDGDILTLPDGFAVDRWVSGRGSLRMMAVTEDGFLLVTEKDRGNLLGFRLTEEAPQAVTLIEDLRKPSGIAVHEGFIWVAEETEVSKYPYRGNGRVEERQAVVTGLPAGGHDTRTIGFGADGKLYLAMGSSCNLCEEKDQRRAAISRYNADGSDGEILATGLRNTVGFTWHPATGEIWGVDNGRDRLGDDLPPEEVNVIHQGDYGWPFCYGNQMVDPRYQDDPGGAARCRQTEPPRVEMQAHSAPLGLRFLAGSAWPAPYQGSLFIAFHGSWNRSVPTGYKVVSVGPDLEVSDFITGWLDDASGKVWGRPVDIVFAGHKMYISDDAGGSIYRVSLQQ